MQANQIDKVVLVGGATRTPLVHDLLEERLGRPVHCEIEPDLAVAMGAAVQGGLIAGIDVGPILVDITPHTLGISALGELHGFLSDHAFSPIIERNTPLPACRPRSTRRSIDDQEAAEIRVFQGENQDTRYNTLGRRIHDRRAGRGPGGQPDPGPARPRPERNPQGDRHRAGHRPGQARRDRQRDGAVPQAAAQRRRRPPRSRLRHARRAASGRSMPCRRRTQIDEPAARASTTTWIRALREAIESAEASAAKAKRVLPDANAEDADELRAMLDDLEPPSTADRKTASAPSSARSRTWSSTCEDA